VSLHIARMRIRLPAACTARAADIARAVALAAARIPLAPSRSMESLVLGPVRIAPGASDAAVGAAVASSLGAALKAAR
jgi:hypothetical protein